MINFPYKCLNHFRKACLEDYTHTFVDHIIDIMEGREVPEDEKARVYTFYPKKNIRGRRKKSINSTNQREIQGIKRKKFDKKREILISLDHCGRVKIRIPVYVE